MVKCLYGDELSLHIEDNSIINKTTYYSIVFPETIAERVLIDTGIIKLEDNTYVIDFGINNNITFDEQTKVAFLKGAYIGCSTSSIRISEEENKKTTSGYHLEFSSHNYKFLTELSSILAEFNIVTKLVERKKLYVLYIKEAEVIKDLLALLGAHDSVLSLSNEMITREKRNMINRQVNCINANISRTVEASLRQVEAINLIISTIGLEGLPEDLQEVACLRLANQEESLEELISLSNIKLTRSGLNHRLKKILKIAETLK
jgi:DNA-binding protein WhiA